MKKQANAIHIRTWRRGLALCPCCGGIAQFAPRRWRKKLPNRRQQYEQVELIQFRAA